MSKRYKEKAGIIKWNRTHHIKDHDVGERRALDQASDGVHCAETTLHTKAGSFERFLGVPGVLVDDKDAVLAGCILCRARGVFSLSPKQSEEDFLHR